MMTPEEIDLGEEFSNLPRMTPEEIDKAEDYGDALREGSSARLEGIKRTDNPYPSGDHRNDAWHMGWGWTDDEPPDDTCSACAVHVVPALASDVWCAIHLGIAPCTFCEANQPANAAAASTQSENEP